MASSISIRLVLTILLTVFPFNSALLRPACQCAPDFSQKESLSLCCLSPEASKAPSLLARKCCCQTEKDGNANSDLKAVEVGNIETDFPAAPFQTCSQDDCSCGCQQAPELDEISALACQHESDTLKKHAAIGFEPPAAAVPNQIDATLVHERQCRLIPLSSVERCALFCCWLI